MPKKKKDEAPNVEDLISLTEAARLRGVTLSAIQDLIRRGRLSTFSVAGRRLVSRSDVEGFRQAHKGGRGRKADN
jgi:excisionase family DNA binding protein